MSFRLPQWLHAETIFRTDFDGRLELFTSGRWVVNTVSQPQCPQTAWMNRIGLKVIAHRSLGRRCLAHKDRLRSPYRFPSNFHCSSYRPATLNASMRELPNARVLSATERSQYLSTIIGRIILIVFNSQIR